MTDQSMNDLMPSEPVAIEPPLEAPQSNISPEGGNGAAASEAESANYQRAFQTAQAVCQRAADGDLEARITNTQEFGELSPFLVAINKLLDQVDAYVRESAASLEYASQNKYFRPFLLRGMRGDFQRGAEVINTARETMKHRHDLTEEFQETVSKVVDVVSAAATTMESTATGMAEDAQTTHSQSLTVASASEQAAMGAQSVAASTEQLTASIGEIGRQSEQSMAAAETVVAETNQASAAAKELEEAAQRIEQVANFIKDIASQTNLLALNATIEAARAGEAGKGFAVVASEVKTLAGQVADATSDIEGHIASILGASQRTGKSIRDIDTRMQDVREVTSAIASAIQQQSAATEEISTNVQQTAGGAKEISSSVSQITEASEKTGDGAKAVLESARGLSQEADQLSSSVKEFLEKIEAA
jgi:methyl-accepting chemotaxis protein